MNTDNTENTDNQSLYYLAVSGLQKSIRRCIGESARKMARIAHTLEPFRMWQRLGVILHEDCGRDATALKTFAEWTGSYKNWSDVEPLVESLIVAKKSHDAVGHSWLALGEPLPPFDTAQASMVENQAPETTLLGKVLLPSCALDKHTYPGRFVNGVLWKQVSRQAAQYQIERTDIGIMLFITEGSLLNNRVVSEPDYWQLACSEKQWDRFWVSARLDWVQSVVIPKARDFRQWALRKVYPDLLDSLAAVIE